MNFDEWIGEAIERIAIIREKLKERFGNMDKDIELALVKAAIGPWECARQQIQQIKTQISSSGKNEASKGSGLAEIFARYGLVEDNGLLKPGRFLDQGFKDLAKELEVHGYRYNKERRVFLPPWNGVKR